MTETEQKSIAQKRMYIEHLCNALHFVHVVPGFKPRFIPTLCTPNSLLNAVTISRSVRIYKFTAYGLSKTRIYSIMRQKCSFKTIYSKHIFIGHLYFYSNKYSAYFM